MKKSVEQRRDEIVVHVISRKAEGEDGKLLQ